MMATLSSQLNVLMDWLKWRKTTGTRPLKKRDGGSTSLEKKKKLWKKVMDFLHDAD